MSPEVKRKIIDAHMHLYDYRENRYDFLEHTDETFQALIGDYSNLPRQYLLDQYLADEPHLEVAAVVWHEFLSTDPEREVLWAQRMAERLPMPMSIVGLVDFLAPDLDRRLEKYAQCANTAAVREHLGWDQDNPLRRFAKRPDLLTDTLWLQGLRRLARYKLKCSLEVFSSQLPDLLAAVRLNPDIGFTIAVMGWPVRLNEFEFRLWRQGIMNLSTCENVRITISAVECIFGMSWSVQQVEPWVNTVFDLFGPKRIMFGSHHPICGLSRSFPTPYTAYEKLASSLSSAEQDAVFRLNAAEWFFGSEHVSKIKASEQ
jgi:predicted TIM-barrel fold metal-dependent hydrolase